MTFSWVDANVLLRLLTDDPPDLAGRAAAFAARSEHGGHPPSQKPDLSCPVRRWFRYLRGRAREHRVSEGLLSGLSPASRL